MHQHADDPVILRQLVERLRYRPGWSFSLRDMDRGQGSRGLTFIIATKGFNSYHVDSGQDYRVHHYMPVPPAAFDERSWCRWLFAQIISVETHEAMEFFAVNGDRPYAPSHGPGNDPYLIREVGTDVDRRTSFRGEVNA